MVVNDSELKADSVRGDSTKEFEELKEPIQLPTAYTEVTCCLVIAVVYNNNNDC